MILREAGGKFEGCEHSVKPMPAMGHRESAASSRTFIKDDDNCNRKRLEKQVGQNSEERGARLRVLNSIRRFLTASAPTQTYR
jgi:hypothetical protein